MLDRYGCPAHIVMRPGETLYSARVSDAEARLLLSVLVLAATNTGCTVPVFAQACAPGCE